ncbi:hypothetical protein [Bosea sp. UNC402CLCol]|uniref:hypothetical protein n=1 Tax=Bosea sp. UNC402CLCol TaxID=1510531 RepID=UPI000570FA9F|nr:hypothetical protein [Bosea sp. UNC402CLCol]
MDADKKDVALDDEALDAVTGAALTDAMKRIGESLKTDLDKGAGIGGMGISAVIGAGIGA